MPHGSASQRGKYNGNYKHGGKGTKLYEVWCSMKRRCNNPKVKCYKRYGGRGIYVCDEWNDFNVFREWSLQNGYEEGLTIDRINNDGPYSPENCRWVTCKIQSNNQTTTTFIKIGDVEKSLHEWADFVGIKPDTLRYRISIGWPVERAIFEKVTFNKYEHIQKSRPKERNAK